MKKLIFIPLLILSAISFGRGWYVSSSGNDANPGTLAAPWLTLDKVNSSFSTFAPGDSIYLHKGDMFTGTIIVAKSGNSGLPITITSYGTGAKPIINGFVTLSTWTLVSTGIYSADALAVKSTVNMLTIDGIPQAVGRFPNAGTADNGYLRYTDYALGNSQLTAAGLNGTNWTGAEVVARKEGYIIERDLITSQSGSTIQYTWTPTINPRQGGQPLPMTPTQVNFGLFIQRDIRTLDVFGEWYFNPTTKKMYVFFGGGGPGSHVVKVSKFDTLINIKNFNYITVSGLDLEGANLAGIYYQDNRNMTIVGNDINYNGAKAILGWNSPNAVIIGNNIRYSMCSAIDHTGRHAGNATVRLNTIYHTAVFPGMSSFTDDNDAKSISVSVDSFAVINHNRIDSSGYVGINFWGSKIDIDSNFINYFAIVKDDGGGIYTFAQTGYGRRIRHNIILNGIGNIYGNALPYHAEGIYSDHGAANELMQDNVIGYMHNRGIYMNDPKNIQVQGNLLYQTGGWSAAKHYDDSIKTFTLTNNTIFSTAVPVGGNDQNYFNGGLNSTYPPVANNIQLAIQVMGTINNNIYQFIVANTTPFKWFYYNTFGGSASFPAPINFVTWQSYSGHDLGSNQYSNSKIATQLFYYNDQDTVRKLVWPGLRKVDPAGNQYDNAALLQPFTGNVYIESGAAPGNLDPVAAAGNDTTVTLPSNTADLNGLASHDDDGTIPTFHWTQIGGPSTASIINANIAHTTVTGLVFGDYTFALEITDNLGAMSSDQKTVHVVNATPPPNNPPTVDAGANLTITIPVTNVTATGTASDVEGAVDVAWSQVSGPNIATIGTPLSLSTNLSNLVPGLYQFRLTATDRGTPPLSAIDVMSVNVNDTLVNNPPQANPGPDKTIQLPISTVTFIGSGIDDGTISAYLWTGSDGVIATPNNSTTDVTGLTEGDHIFTFKVTDNGGKSDTKTVVVHVLAAENTDLKLLRGFKFQP